MIYDPDAKYPVALHRSVGIIDTTKCNTFMTCPRKYFLNYVLGWSLESNHLVFGKAWHEALEYLILNGYDQQIPAFEKFLVEYMKTYKESEFNDFWPKTPDRAWRALKSYAERYKSDPHYFTPHEINGNMLTEIAGSVWISDEYELYFRMDAVMRDLDSGKLFFQEHKTGSSSYQFAEKWELAMQVYTYLYTLYCMFEVKDIKGGQINAVLFKKTKDSDARDAKDGLDRHFEFIRVPIYRAVHQLEAWMVRTQYWLDMIKFNFELLANEDPAAKVLRAFPMCTESCGNYGGCEYKPYCISLDNPLREHLEVGVPLGMNQKFWDPTEGEINVDLGRLKL